MDWLAVFIFAPLILAALLTLLGRWWAPGKGDHAVEGRGKLPYDAPHGGGGTYLG